MMYQFKDEKLKFEIKNNLNKMLTNIVSDKPAYFDISIRIKGYFEENETIILPKPLRLKESLLDKINEDKEKHGYKEIETMIVDALDNYYEGC